MIHVSVAAKMGVTPVTMFEWKSGQYLDRTDLCYAASADVYNMHSESIKTALQSSMLHACYHERRQWLCFKASCLHQNHNMSGKLGCRLRTAGLLELCIQIHERQEGSGGHTLVNGDIVMQQACSWVRGCDKAKCVTPLLLAHISAKDRTQSHMQQVASCITRIASKSMVTACLPCNCVALSTGRHVRCC